MKRSGNTALVVVVVLAILAIFGGVAYYAAKQSKTQTAMENQTPSGASGIQEGTGAAGAMDTSNSSIDADLKATDTKMNSLDTDAKGVDQGLSTTPEDIGQ